MTFFIPMVIGKAMIKISLQIAVLYVAFSGHVRNMIIDQLSEYSNMAHYARPMLDSFDNTMTYMFESKEELRIEASHPGTIARIWHLFIVFWILYFLVILANDFVRN